MGKMIDITGNTYNRLRVLGFSHHVNYHYKWKCVCECGTELLVDAGDLKSGHTKSCGCFNQEQKLVRSKTHGMSRTRLFRIHAGIRTRIFNKNCYAYKNYGGRGIKLCEEWGSFENFYEWAINNGYEKTLTIDRVDGDGNYEPSNCRWIPKEEQSKNRRGLVTFNGENAAEAARRLGASDSTITARVKAGWSLEDAFTRPVQGLCLKK